jgi:hypothetical protein
MQEFKGLLALVASIKSMSSMNFVLFAAPISIMSLLGVLNSYKKTTILLIIAFSLPDIIHLNAQTTADFAYKIRVDEVDFEGQPNQVHKLTMIRDYDPNPTITGVAWKYPNLQTPVAFVSGKKVRISAKFDLGGCTQNIYAKGENPEGHNPPPVKLINGVYPLTDLNLGTGLTNRVKFFDPFTVTWYISSSASGPWVKVGISINPLYIVLNAPQTSPLFHSLVYHSCKGAKDKTSNNDVVNGIYDIFMTRKVIRKDSPTFLSGMKYWAWPEPSGQAQPDPIIGFYFSTKDLLKYENGRCQAWAFFFQDMLKTHGINDSQISVVDFSTSIAMDNAFSSEVGSYFGTSLSNVTFFNPFNTEIFVKKFNFSTEKFYKWDREWMPLNATRNTETLTNNNLLIYAPDDGLTNPTQGNSNPISTFWNHAIVKYKNKYFDPSYGTPIKDSANDWETASLDGFGFGGSFISYKNPITSEVSRVMWIYQFNTSILQSTITP